MYITKCLLQSSNTKCKVENWISQTSKLHSVGCADTNFKKISKFTNFLKRILKWWATNFRPTNQHLLLVLLDVVAVGRCERRCPWLSATDSHWRRSGRCMMCSAGTRRLHRRRQRSRRCLYLGLLRRAVTRLHYADYKAAVSVTFKYDEPEVKYKCYTNDRASPVLSYDQPHTHTHTPV